MASGEVALAGLDLMQALRAGNKLQAAASLVRLVNNAQIAANQEPVLGAVGTGLSGAVAIVSALDQWGDASDGQRIALAARAVLGANDVARAISADGKGFIEAGATLSALQGVIALASLKDVLESGNPFAIASTFMALANSVAAMAAATTASAATAATATSVAAAGAGSVPSAAIFGPQAMIAVAICSVVFASVFEVEYPDPPPAGTVEIGRLADGTLGLLIKDEAGGQVHQTRRLDGQVVSDSAKATDTLDWGLGAQVLSQRMGEVIGELRAQAETVGGHLVLERLPALTVHAFPSFAGNGQTNFFFSLQFNDPVSGAQQLLATAHQDLTQRYAQVAAYAGALVGDTEWAQIGLKRAAGDAFATETEGQYVDRQSGPAEADSLLTQAQADAQAASTPMAELAVIDTRLEVGNAVSELAVLKERQKEADSALKAAEFARAQALAEQASRTSAELAEARRRWQAGQQEAIKAAYREEHQVLTAPMAGTVQQLAVHTVGGVVNPAQGLMVVVPQEGGIEVEAQVLNKDVGFLRVGMPATVKLDAFEFTKFGALDGVVQWIAADAVKDERLGSYYPVRIALKGTHLPVAVGGQHPVARLGMAVTADVLIGQRKAYEFFLGPLLKYQKESLRER